MPNHITNIITIEGASIKDILAIVDTSSKGDHGSQFDFNAIVPMPEELHNTISGSYGEDDPRQEALILQQKQNVEKYGYPTWYEFALAKWGTKWNAYDITVTDDSIQFDTAWSTPEPIICELSKLIPQAIITVEFADEDWGHNCGIYEYSNGDLTYDEDMSSGMVGKEKSLTFVSRVKYGDPDYIATQIEEND